jgi:hypothetical protein
MNAVIADQESLFDARRDSLPHFVDFGLCSFVKIDLFCPYLGKLLGKFL